MKLKYFAFLALIVTFFACDELDEPYFTELSTGGGEVEFEPETDYKKKVFLEDYTGHKCGNCPRAHEKLAELMTTHGDQLVPMAIHVGWFAKVDAEHPTDFNTETGDALDDIFAVESAGLPQGMINRSSYGGSHIISPEQWDAAVNEQLATTQLINIQMINEYETENRTLKNHLQIEVMDSPGTNLQLSVYLVENDIESPQTDYDADPEVIEDYIHNHVLRTAINGNTGSPLFTEGYATGDFQEISFEYAIPAEWVAENCHVIAIVFDADTYVVYQAEEAHVVTE